MTTKHLVKTEVTPENKATAMPHPDVACEGDPDMEYETGGAKGEEMSFIPSK